ncbi:MAG: acyloxyacyl hydrolase [Rhodospirillales bacterium]|nr:deacylase [Rhodospirillaceae bacterium]MDP6430587.1 acyloxyacyl hydrolase [Rhodospirillales bacterium]MDP6645301.1 acyloxyacyl hydrolase [Rhodospirillales bacterium]MDP6841619.1 acyloxyacyl hydrolase [Rhodospirillales bacterium]
MKAVIKSIALGLIGVLMMAADTRPALADDPDFLTIGAGWFDFNRQKDQGAELRLEYRSDKKLWLFKPFAAAAYASPGHGFIGAGVLVDIFLGRRLVLTPSIAPHYYWGGDSDLDLGHALEFRSQLEFAYRFDNRSRLGVAISHYSNASLGDTNPGTETVTLYYSIPFDSLFGR